MGKIAFIFSGQGDQHPGMGKDLYENYAVCREIYDICDEIRPGTSDQSFCGTEEKIKKTKNTQPCLFAMELAAASMLIQKGVIPDAVAGFSLGELTAATISGAFDKKTGFALVCKRAELMQKETEKYDTSMLAVLKLSHEEVQAVCSNYSDVYPVNYNCPGQITVSGMSSQMKDFAAAIKEAGGRVIPLKVKGAFHSPFMKEAAEAFADELNNADIRACEITCYSNLTAEPYDEDIAGLLSAQICNPVQWEKIIRNMIASDIDTFIEIGPGRTLTNMVKKINPDVRAVSFDEYTSEVDEC